MTFPSILSLTSRVIGVIGALMEIGNMCFNGNVQLTDTMEPYYTSYISITQFSEMLYWPGYCILSTISMKTWAIPEYYIL